METALSFLSTAILSIVAHFATYHFISVGSEKLLKGGLFGIDLNKITRPAFFRLKRSLRTHSLTKILNNASTRSRLIPESAGIIVGCVYICTVLVLAYSIGLPVQTIHPAVCSIAIMLLVGFVDDVLELRWALKIAFSAISCIPLVTSEKSGRFLVLPVVLRGGLIETFLTLVLPGPHKGASIGLGCLHTLIITLICMFCANAINIYAGVNGLEAGQSIIISANILVYAVWHVRRLTDRSTIFVLQLPFICCALALYRLNRYPAKVFVGDSFTYLAGMVFAVTAISTTFSKTLMLFLIPQIVNFLLSVPQLCGFVHCPPHRIPHWNHKDDVLESSGNLTLVNVVLRMTGPLHEQTLVNVLLIIQVVCGCIGLGILELVKLLY